MITPNVATGAGRREEMKTSQQHQRTKTNPIKHHPMEQKPNITYQNLANARRLTSRRCRGTQIRKHEDKNKLEWGEEETTRNKP